jgi:hypothetical protein
MRCTSKSLGVQQPQDACSRTLLLAKGSRRRGNVAAEDRGPPGVQILPIRLELQRRAALAELFALAEPFALSAFWATEASSVQR